jgi:hypothetical protein
MFPYSVYIKQGQSVTELPARSEAHPREPNSCSDTQEIQVFYGT